MRMGNASKYFLPARCHAHGFAWAWQPRGESGYSSRSLDEAGIPVGRKMGTLLLTPIS